ncbi:cryptochrome/photolyase family protein [Catellatospora methionotrophica]|uniref:cryptochrome/photolyase family protein n=1 Tax=Catellatospora methionotrophica TaxID=121620 RepID=UPI00140882AC|nr:deoxyribodipyrimidine photo-lyase [Catellatospora methionotrophica]
MIMKTVVVLLTRDLRVHDHPALAASCANAERVVPLFVADPALAVPDNRRRFLLESLQDLRDGLRKRGGDLLVRSGDPVAEAVRLAREVGAEGIALTADVSAYAARRQERLTRACARERIALKLFPGVTIVPAGEVTPSTGGDHYKVFTPYWRAWQSKRWRSTVATPRRVPLPDGLTGDDPRTVLGEAKSESPSPMPGGETEALRRLKSWQTKAAAYADRHDDLPGDATSRVSPYLHFGCLSPLALATADGMPDAYQRQLCWRDFYHQLLAAFPKLGTQAYRPGAQEQWKDDPKALQAWQAGETGVPIVDAGMKQLAAEGWMHNRARLVTASYLTKTLGLDWRDGAAWFNRLLIDADVANNNGNWQWVAGTGTDTKPYRRFSPDRQAERFDPDGEYVRRWT